MRLPEHDLVLPHWPRALDGLRVAVVADLHAGGPRVGPRQIDRLVAAVDAASPDLIALVGDYVDPHVVGGRRADPAEVARRLARLRAPAVAVLGNHDWHDEGHAMLAALRHAGIRTLENEAAAIPLRGTTLNVAGLADLRERDPRVGSALNGVPEPILLLSHDPDVFPYVPERVSLTLSGHLHGGQVDLPLIRRRMPSRHGTRYRAGHVVEQGRHLFVTRGVGEAFLPIRVRSPAEVPILRLQSEETAAKSGTT